jgi:hypothetical protein
VVVHEAISMANPVGTLVNLSENVKKQFAVASVLEDGFAIIATGCDVVKRPVILNS